MSSGSSRVRSKIFLTVGGNFPFGVKSFTGGGGGVVSVCFPYYSVFSVLHIFFGCVIFKGEGGVLFQVLQNVLVFISLEEGGHFLIFFQSVTGISFSLLTRGGGGAETCIALSMVRREVGVMRIHHPHSPGIKSFKT